MPLSCFSVKREKHNPILMLLFLGYYLHLVLFQHSNSKLTPIGEILLGIYHSSQPPRQL